MRTNSVRIHVGNLSTNLSKDLCRLLTIVALKTHKFSKILSGKLSTNFGKDLHPILTRVRCPNKLTYTDTHTYTKHVHLYLHTDSYLYTRAYTYLSSYTNTLKTFTQTLSNTHIFQHTHLATCIIRTDSIRRPSGPAAEINFILKDFV